MFDETDYSETIPGGDVQLEYWKEIAPGYWLSDCGTVYSFKSHKCLATGRNVNNKYPAVRISHGGKEHTKLYSLHRLLAENFIPNPNNYPVVRHLNDNPDDYDLSNLEWGTYKDNWEDSIVNERFVGLPPEDSQKGNAARKKPVLITDIRTSDQRMFGSLHDAARCTGYDAAYICCCLKGKWKNRNWKFEYIEEE